MDPIKPAQVVKDALEKAVEKVADLVTPPVPGTPGSVPPPVDPPNESQGPLPRKPDQASPATRTATGAETGAAADTREQQAEYLTTAQGARLYDTDHSLKAGERGPTLLQDHHLREKITHFDHERIPERVVHARGAAAHGVHELRKTINAAGLTPMLVAARGGQLEDGLVAQRTFLTARSVEFDALLLAAAPPPGPDALPSRDA